MTGADLALRGLRWRLHRRVDEVVLLWSWQHPRRRDREELIEYSYYAVPYSLHSRIMKERREREVRG